LQPADLARSKSFIPPAFSATRPTLDKLRVAVLPLQNISPDPKDEFFADGMTEELISTMSKISGFKVIARTSVMRYKGGCKSVAEVARELMVGTILEGSVRKAGEKLRITVQLIDSTSEEHLWAQNYDRRLEDVFAIQTEVAQNVADSLKMQLLEVEKERIAKKPTQNISAYTLYLKGRYYWNKRNKESLEKSIELFEEAIKRDPKFALAYSGLADSYLVSVNQGYVPPSEGYAKAMEAAMKALELDDTLAEAHTSLASILDAKWDWSRAEEEFAKALRINPNYATAHHWYAIHLMFLGRLEEAIKEIEIAKELDPLSPAILTEAGYLYWCARKHDTALGDLNSALEFDSNFLPALAQRVYVYLAKSMFEEAQAELERVMRLLQPLSIANKARVGSLYAVSGRTAEAKQYLQECEEASAQARAEDVNLSTAPLHLALTHLKLGNRDRAFEWLQTAFNAHGRITPYEIKHWQVLEELTSDPIFDELVQKSGAAERLPRQS
jgi:TolB-like protein/Flp pilus assembly protein TadD